MNGFLPYDIDSNSSLPTTQTKPRSSHPFYRPPPPLAQSRYNRQLLIPQISLQGQQRICAAKVLIVGLGGLGSPASLYLAGAGIHTLGLLDHDVVEQSNLHRQIVHREWSLAGSSETSGPAAWSKVQSALRSCRELNSDVHFVAHEVKLSGANALDVIKDYDVVLDCTDNPATRYLVSDCCVVLGKTLVSGAAQKLDGQMVILNWPIYDVGEGRTICGRGPCYRCVFPHPPSPDLVKSCSEIGILGPVVGAIGTLMASETLRLIVKDAKEERKPTMLLYNAWPSDPRSMFRVIGLRGRRKDCVGCGEDETLAEKGLERITDASIREGGMDYESWCGMAEHVHLLREDERVDADVFTSKLSAPGRERPVVVDVREEFEVELGSKIEGSINIPFSRILRSNGSINGVKQADALDAVVEDTESGPVYFVCQRGNDSQIAAKKLMDRVADQRNGADAVPERWIGDVRGGFAAIDKFTEPS